MKNFIKIIALILGVGPVQSKQLQVHYHNHPTTFHINGNEVKLKPRRSINSLSTSEFVKYYHKSKNIICL